MAQDRIDPNEIQWEGPAARKQAQQETEGAQQEVIRGQTIRANEATIPYQAPQAAANLENAQNTARFKSLEQSQKLRQDFENSKPVRDYADTIPALTAALKTAPNSAGDQMLLYYAAKMADPGSVVRESEQASWANTQPIVQQLQARFGKEVFGGGTFTQSQRNIIRAELLRTMRLRNVAYNRERANYLRTAKRYGLDPEDVIGEHAGLPFQDELNQYAKGLTAPTKDAKSAEQQNVGAFDAAPEGARIAGEDIKAYRYSPEQEEVLTGLFKQPDFSPAEYANRATEFAVANGDVPEEAADKFRADALARAAEIANMPPEERAKANFKIDYGEADREATENAGLFAGIAQGFRNAPESGAQLIQGLSAVPVDAAISTLKGERYGTTKTLTDLGGELAGYATGDEAGPTMQAAGSALEERYGGGKNLKRTAVTDPIGLASDISIPLTAGGTGLAKAPGMVGKFGEKLATVGRVMDPLSAGVGVLTEGVPAAYRAANAKAPKVVEGAKNLTTDILGLPSGVGGASLREGAKAGFERGRTGAPTARSEAFTENMRNPGVGGEDLVTKAREALTGMRDAASQKYTDAMQQFGRTPVPLDIDNVRMKIASIRPKNYDAMLDAPRRPSDHTAWEQINDTVEHYAAKAQQDPTLLEPLAMDQFKQDLYDIGSKIGGAYDRDAARIAGQAYNAVKKELIDHDPVYAKTMKDYETAIKEVQQLEGSFALGAARGKQPNVESAVRRLQSIMRNNAYTNYGARAEQGKRLSERGDGSLMAGTAGQMASSWAPRGLNTITGVGLGGGAAIAGVPIWGPQALAAGAFSPRLMGEAAYGAGRAAGTGARVAAPAIDAGSMAAKYLMQKYQDNPGIALALSQTGEAARATEQEKRDEMLRRYGVPVTPLDYGTLDRYSRN